MAEVIAVPGSVGAAVGLALQGALNNLAGGILLMILHDRNFRESRPKISAAGKEKPGPGEKKEYQCKITICQEVFSWKRSRKC